MEPTADKISRKHRLILALIPFAVFLIRVIGLTMRIRLIDPQGNAPQAKRGPKFIYAFWHNQQLLASYYFRDHGIQVLVSRSRDGDYIAKVLDCFGFGTVRSSTSSGKLTALRGLARQLHAGHHVAITPDGPRGPIYKAQPGPVFLAMLSGHAIAPFGCAVDRVWRLKSWDHFEIPKPFSRAAIVYGELLPVPAKLDEAGVRQTVEKLELALADLRAAALEAAGRRTP